MSSNSAPSVNGNSSNDPDAYIKPSADLQPWYPNFGNAVITNERRPGRYTKSEKRKKRASLLPVLPNPDDGKEYVLGGKYAKPVEQIDAEFAEQLKVEKAMGEEELYRMGMFVPVADTTDCEPSNGCHASGSGGSEESVAGRGRGVRLSYGGMRGVGRARCAFVPPGDSRLNE